jgi:Mn-dependent DtxR family transcriptional regulator
MHLQESGEMYLETILILSQQKSFVRAIDVGEYMGFTKPSVSRALSLLRSGGFVIVGDGGGLSLTEAGREVAEKIYERHTYITKFLVNLGVSEKTAAEDACRMEHVISDESFRAMQEHYFRYTKDNTHREA